ncbi:MAG: SLBB domain-containing protein [candidate division WOR-3 bacterium]
MWSIILLAFQLLVPGDGIVIKSTNYRELNDTILVISDTTAELPYIGSIKVGHLHEENLRTFFVDTYSKYLKDPDITVFPVYRVIVIGRVNRPGIYYLPSFASLADVIAIAGGPTSDGSTRKIKILNENKVFYVNLSATIKRGESIRDLNIKSGTIVMVPKKLSIGLEEIYKFAATTGILWSVYRDIIKR